MQVVVRARKTRRREPWGLGSVGRGLGLRAGLVLPPDAANGSYRRMRTRHYPVRFRADLPRRGEPRLPRRAEVRRVPALGIVMLAWLSWTTCEAQPASEAGGDL